MYINKYLKYKDKYFKHRNNIQNGGTRVQDILESLINSGTLKQCQEIVKLSEVNKEFPNNINWNDIDSPLLTNLYIDELIVKMIPNEIDDEDTEEIKTIKENFRFYLIYKLKCKLKNLFKKYFKHIREPIRCSKTSIDYLLKKMIVTENSEEDYNFLIDFGVDKIINIDDRFVDVYKFNKNYTLSFINIPDTVIIIGEYAFCYCKLKKVTIPDSVERILSYAFFLSHIEELIIGNSVKIIGKEAFGKNKLKKILIPDNVVRIDEKAFFSNEIKELSIGDSVKIIDEWAFYNNEIEELIIGESVEIINKHAFMKNRLHKVLIPNSVKVIGTGAFFKNSIKEIIIPRKFKSSIMNFFQFDDIVKITYT